MTVSVPNAKLRTRRRWILPVLVAWGTLGLPVTMVALLMALVKVTALYSVPVLYFAGIFGLEWLMRRWLLHRGGELRADESGLYLAGKLLVARKKLTYGHVIRDGETLLLRLVPLSKNAQPIDVEVADEAQANELLAAMYLDRSVAEYTMNWRKARGQWKQAAALIAGMIGFLFGGLIVAGELARHFRSDALFSLLLMLVTALPIAGSVLVAMASQIHFAVGSDGVWVRQFIRLRRFVPFRDIASVEQDGRDVTIALRDGTKLDANHATHREDDAASLVARVRAGIEAAKTAPQHAADAVARNGRTIAEWIASVGRKHERSANYRAAVVPQDELWRIVEDAAAAPTERAGAALALRADLDDEGRARLRVAAGGCAEQKLRVALESVGKPDDAALEGALERLDDEALAPRRAARLPRAQ